MSQPCILKQPCPRCTRQDLPTVPLYCIYFLASLHPAAMLKVPTPELTSQQRRALWRQRAKLQSVKISLLSSTGTQLTVYLPEATPSPTADPTNPQFQLGAGRGAGISVGVLVFVAICAGAGWWFWRRRRRRQRAVLREKEDALKPVKPELEGQGGVDSGLEAVVPGFDGVHVVEIGGKEVAELEAGEVAVMADGGGNKERERYELPVETVRS
ncbi:hypothetical protein EDC01DRAFT_675606 [Geopyxis carbonaria]|nr:hypothetical protein EDC01DRAFT_675606 [Geopyxis carbonaria]